MNDPLECKHFMRPGCPKGDDEVLVELDHIFIGGVNDDVVVPPDLYERAKEVCADCPQFDPI